MTAGVPARPNFVVHELAEEIADRFAHIAPGGFSCIAYETWVILTQGHRGLRHLDLADAPDWSAQSWTSDLRAVLWQVLSDFQDEIVHRIAGAWPTTVTGGLALPHSKIEGAKVFAWYGTHTDAIIRLDPIPLASGLERP